MKWPEQINQVVEGDNIESLRAIPDGSIHCVVTSPPYFGLRDYGTGQWKGGDSEHEHRGSVARTVSGGAGKQYTNVGSNRVFSGDCECGAKRIDKQRGLEKTPQEYVDGMVEVFREVYRVLRDDGTLWINIGDSYATQGGHTKQGSTSQRKGRSNISAQHAVKQSVPDGLKQKDLIGIPWMVAFALRADGWYLRSDIIWHKPNPMPESVTDRPTRAHEYIFLMTKSQRYYYDAEAIKESQVSIHGSGNGFKREAQISRDGRGSDEQWEPSESGRNKRSVWTVNTKPYSEAHFATFPIKLIEPCILAGTSERGACSQCGSPLIRQIKKDGGRDWRNDTMKSKGIPGELNGEGSYKRGQSTSPLNDVKTITTIGWKPDCECNAPTTACIVLDPFGGAGTTGLVAAKHRRDFILLELNPEYCEIARRRIEPELRQGKLL